MSEMGVAVLTLQGGGQALLSNKVSVEYPSIYRCHLPRPSPQRSPVPARVGVPLRVPIVQEGRDAAPRGLPAPGPVWSPVEQMTWPGVCRAGRVLCLLGGAGCPRPASHSVDRQSQGSREPGRLQRRSRLPTSRLLPSASSDWSAPLQRGRGAGGSRGLTRLPIGGSRLSIEEGGQCSLRRVSPSALRPARGAGRLSEGGGDGAPGGGSGSGSGGDGFLGRTAGRRR